MADLFNDGNVDVVINDLDGKPMILKNHGIPGRHWISFELAGTRSNRLALNTRVRISAAGMTQTDEVHSGGSYLSQNDLRLHFGLGSAEKVDSVEIRWSSNRRPPDRPRRQQIYSVQEGSGIVPLEHPATVAKPVVRAGH